MRRLYSTLLTHAHDSHKVHDIVPPFETEEEDYSSYCSYAEDTDASQITSSDLMESSGFVTETEEDYIPIQSTNATGVTMVKLSNAKKHLASKFSYTGEESFSRWLRGVDGFMIVPVRALTLFRKPDKYHKYDPTIIFYTPTDNSNIEWNLSEALEILNSNQ